MTEDIAIMFAEAQKEACGYGGSMNEFLNLAIQALEKQIPMKPKFELNFSDTSSRYRCSCGEPIKVRHDIGVFNNNDAPKYCKDCGQKLDWSEE